MSWTCYCCFSCHRTHFRPFGSQVKNKTAQNCKGSETSVLELGSFVVDADTLQQKLVLSQERRVSFCQSWLFGASMGTKCMLRKYVRVSHKINKVTLDLFTLECPNAFVHMTLSGCTQNDCCVTFQI